MAGGSGRKDEDPTAPGWYPDPWSATGEGERYFDGTRWGTTERPLARHTVAVMTPDPIKSDRSRRVFLPIVILVVLVAAVWGVPKLLDNDSGSDETGTPQQSIDAPPASTEEAAEPLGKPARVPEGNGTFEVSQHQRGSSTPVAFDPCRPIHYVVNVAGAPTDGLAIVKRSIATVSTATGLKFVYDGASSEVPDKEREAYQPSQYSDRRWAPVLIAWTDEASFSELSGYIAGVGSTQPVRAQNGRLVYVTGQVVLDGEQLSTQLAPNRAEVDAIALHELGHLVGLDHTSDRTQLMFSEAQFNVDTYGDGDLRGLALLGRQACFPGV
jgi:hypothetical protein